MSDNKRNKRYAQLNSPVNRILVVFNHNFVSRQTVYFFEVYPPINGGRLL